nr:MAG TPA: hypothetical protein [Crassvirales sp.]
MNTSSSQNTFNSYYFSKISERLYAICFVGVY